MDHIHDNVRVLYSKQLLSLCKVMSVAGACEMWFGGSFPDMLVSGALALAVNKIGTSQAFAYEERVLTEVASSFLLEFVLASWRSSGQTHFVLGPLLYRPLWI
jgi:hypothetical protein